MKRLSLKYCREQLKFLKILPNLLNHVKFQLSHLSDFAHKYTIACFDQYNFRLEWHRNKKTVSYEN